MVRLVVSPWEPGSDDLIEMSSRAEKSGDNEGTIAFNREYLSQGLDFLGSV
ncbi:MAG: hypothetical protein IIB17_00105 [Chloroflexi bacterium]|nr:hypothetical protein [Chloroflexota bacterium]